MDKCEHQNIKVRVILTVTIAETFHEKAIEAVKEMLEDDSSDNLSGNVHVNRDTLETIPPKHHFQISDVPRIDQEGGKRNCTNVTKSLVRNSIPICMQDDHTPSTAIEKETNILFSHA